jgi:hypothetical protein
MQTSRQQAVERYGNGPLTDDEQQAAREFYSLTPTCTLATVHEFGAIITVQGELYEAQPFAVREALALFRASVSR